VEKPGTVTGLPILGSLDLFNFDGIRLHPHALNIINAFLLERYRCVRGGIGVRQGDAVIDAGGCWGDTALYFAQNAAQVFCFDCIPSNINVMDENLGMKADLSSKIKVIHKALWSSSVGKLLFKHTGSESRPGSDGVGVDVETEKLDHYVSAYSAERVDFIKNGHRRF